MWYHNDQPVHESPDFQLGREADKFTLVIKELYLEDSGEYKVVAQNEQGTVQSKCRVHVERKCFNTVIGKSHSSHKTYK